MFVFELFWTNQGFHLCDISLINLENIRIAIKLIRIFTYTELKLNRVEALPVEQL